jgi:hypothetical protein
MGDFYMKEINCIICNEKLSEKCKLNCYPEEFSVYLCSGCGHENEWWILSGFDKDTKGELEPIIRALFLDSFLQGKEIMYPQVVQHIKEKYKDANYSVDAVQNALNRLFMDVLVKKEILADRSPISKLHNEKYNKIIISHDNTLDDFFNKRIIRQWDLKHLTIDLKELKEKIRRYPKMIRYKNRWLAAFDYFLDCAEKKI